MKLSRLAMLAFTVTLFLSGCAMPPRTAQDDANVHSVAIVSQLQELAPVRRIGITVFNNSQTTLDQGGKLNEIAIETTRQHLQASHPDWTVKIANAKPAPLADGKAAALLSEAELAALARSLDVDQLFVINGSSNENSPGYGVGIVVRALGFEPKFITVHSFISLTVTDRNAKTVFFRNFVGDGSKGVETSKLGLKGDLSTLTDPDVRAKVSAVARAMAWSRSPRLRPRR